MRNEKFEGNVELHSETVVKSVAYKDGMYCLTTENGQDFHSKTKPILANGFNGGHKFVAHLFEERGWFSFTY